MINKIALRIQDLLALALALFSLYTAMFGVFTDVIQRSAHIMFVLAIVYLNVFKNNESKGVWPVVEKTISVFLAIVSLIVFGYTVFTYQQLAETFGRLNQIQIMLGFFAVLLVLEGVRRTAGPPITIISSIFFLYALYGNYFPGIFRHRGYSLTRVITHLYASANGLFSTPLGTSATIIIIFVIFGAFLDVTKGSNFFMNISFALTGSKKGGPAKAAVVASAMMGMVSGSASANVAATGVYTIPLMKKTGYKPEVAGAIEAVASTGSQMTPPIMGAGAFIIAETLGLSYGTIAASAIIPALFYFTSVFIMVHLEAGKAGLRGLDSKTLPNVKATFIDYGHTIVPLVILIIFITLGYSAMYTGFYAIIASVIVSVLRKTTRVTPVQIVSALVKGAKKILPISCACAAAGIVTGCISITGLGLKLSNMIIQLSGGHLIVALILTSISVIILGMGLPTAPAYILVAVLVVPALTQLGVPVLAAHLFIFYGACISSITPPVCMAAFTAASMAQSNPMKTGLIAFKLGIVALIVPFFFVYEPALIGVGSISQIVVAIITGLIGCFGLSLFVQGYFITKISPVIRLMALVGGLISIYPGFLTDIVGLILIAIVVSVQKYIFGPKNTERVI
ncbi:MAG: TRAP transporter permease [Spirochaetales bacterium]|nr:TRAP transporter permease [Spirochaetales bacterium]